MKVAIISDIHGNYYALKEVLKTAKRENVEKLLILGDLVGYYYSPDRVIEMISKWDYELIRGNHENLLSDLLNGIIEETELRKKYGSGHLLATRILPAETISQIIAAPASKNIEIDNIRFSMHHGAPWDADMYLYPDSERALLYKCNDPKSDYVLVGHSHYSFLHRNLDSTLINVGSVGQSRSVGGIANWTIINTSNNVVEMKATPYDTNALMKQINEIDPDVPYLLDILNRNRS